MGVATTPVGAAPSAVLPRHVELLRRVIPPALRGRTAFRRFALWSVLTNVLIVVSGGAVRLTDSGLGCPTWPRCTDASLTPTHEYAIHGVIEFTNRQLTFVVAFFAIATWLIAMARIEHRRLATVAALSIPAQAVLGGLTVLTDLNPWLVAAHFLLSAAIIAVTFLLWWRVSDQVAGTVPAPVRWLTVGVAAASLLVLVAGTVVTGAGPHAGDLKHGTVNRIDLPINGVAQLHADLVMVLIGLTLGAVAAGYALPAPGLRRAALVLLGVELSQGVLGYTQYFLHVPPVLVGLHMLGATLVWIAALWLLLSVRAAQR